MNKLLIKKSKDELAPTCGANPLLPLGDERYL